MSNRKTTLETAIRALHEELNEIETAESREKAKALDGRCFRYRNCYSCPESDADYWWVYGRVSLDADGDPQMLRFQTDKDGKVTVEPTSYIGHTDMAQSGWQEIPLDVFDAAWEQMLRHLDGLRAAAPSTVGLAGADAVARDPQGDSGPVAEA